MRKKRIFSLLLSVIMVLSICASPFSSVFAISNIDPDTVSLTMSGSALTQAANTVLSSVAGNNPIDTMFDNTIKGYKNNPADTDATDPFEIAGEIAIGIFELILDIGEDSEGEDPGQKVLDKLDDISSKMDAYHSETMASLGRIELAVESQNFKSLIKDLNSQNRRAVTAIKNSNDKKYLKVSSDKVLTLAEVRDNEAYAEVKANLEKCYSNIDNYALADTSYHTNFTKVCSYIIGDGTTTPAFDLALQTFLAQYPDADARTINEYYKAYLTATVKELVLSYNCLTTAYKARANYYTLQNNTNAAKTAKEQATSIKKFMRAVIDRYLKAYQTDCTVMSVKVDNGNEKYFASFSKGWAVATESLQQKKNVVVTLYQDLTPLTGGTSKGFAATDTTDQMNKNGYTRDGGLYINAGGSMTLNLNGHKIDGGNRQMDLIELAADANLTVNGASGLKDGQVQGLYNARTAIKADVGKAAARTEIALNNVQMKNFTEYGVYSVSDTENSEKISKFTYSGGSIEGAQKGAIYIKSYHDCTISNCVFKNNKAEQGGAIYASNTHKEGETGLISGCTFENNSATNVGGAIRAEYSGEYKEGWRVENCTFTKNTAGRGGAASHLYKVQGCTFTENTSKNGGGALDQPCLVDNCTFTGNECTEQDGGAIAYTGTKYNRVDGITNSTFINNHSTGDGGAISQRKVENTSIRIENSKFENNLSKKQGGAIYTANDDTITVKNSTFTGNTAWNAGGAICTDNYCTAKIEDSVFTGNSSKDYDGGALFLTGLRSEDHILKNVTITGNTAKHWGGGVCCQNATSTGDFCAEGKVVIDGNTAEKGSNVMLEQKEGSGKCVIKDKTEDGTRIGLNTDYDEGRAVVYDLRNESRFFGDEGRGLEKDGSDLRTKTIGGSSGGGCNK